MPTTTARQLHRLSIRNSKPPSVLLPSPVSLSRQLTSTTSDYPDDGVYATARQINTSRIPDDSIVTTERCLDIRVSTEDIKAGRRRNSSMLLKAVTTRKTTMLSCALCARMLTCWRNSPPQQGYNGYPPQGSGYGYQQQHSPQPYGYNQVWVSATLISRLVD